VDHYVRIIKSNTPAHNDDRVCSYAMELLTLGLLWLSYYDSVREGDSDRIVRTWKFNLLVFKATRRNNYLIEALNLILQVEHILSPREAAQVMWSRTVNTINCPGDNVPVDLHLEHLNQQLVEYGIQCYY